MFFWDGGGVAHAWPACRGHFIGRLFDASFELGQFAAIGGGRVGRDFFDHII
jgi:hypothetical protein